MRIIQKCAKVHRCTCSAQRTLHRPVRMELRACARVAPASKEDQANEPGGASRGMLPVLYTFETAKLRSARAKERRETVLRLFASPPACSRDIPNG